MNGVHDMGGMHGMGAVPYEQDEPVFHHPWEGRVYAMVRVMRGWRLWTLDSDRHAIEQLPPGDYLRMSYYERWFAALVEQLVRHGVATREEIASLGSDPCTTRLNPLSRPVPGSDPATRRLNPLSRLVPGSDPPADAFNRGIPSAVEPAVRPNFTVGQDVRARNINPAGHTRLPRYARGKRGRIVRDHGVYDFPDTAAHGLGEQRQHVYSVRFAARELWGAVASPRDSVHVDLWDDYLEPD